ncbi:MAG: AAC(3) family N-acetyltransferase [Candidatus Dormibacteraeota bacterium]|nr:AAC(3) family N-acetyltransferase [Candidatus Dormibacteraeota bacterium]
MTVARGGGAAFSAEDVAGELARAGVGNVALCLHSSLSSFRHLEDGPASVVDALVLRRVTVLVPAFSWDAFAVWPPPAHLRPDRNGTSYAGVISQETGSAFAPGCGEIDADMGAIPKEILGRSTHIRGDHPLCSFAALGPGAVSLVGQQTWLDVHAPLAVLVERGGLVALAGVGLDRMTLIHLAEQRAGRTPFRRWARAADGPVQMVSVGGCSEGFGNLEPVLAPLGRSVMIAGSTWRIFPAAVALAAAVSAIRADPRITHCAGLSCERCNDAVSGGPIV